MVAPSIIIATGPPKYDFEDRFMVLCAIAWLIAYVLFKPQFVTWWRKRRD
jgi:hypothetical protein